MKTNKTYDEFKTAMRKAGIKISRSVYSDFIGVRLKTAQGCQLNNTATTQAFREKYQAELDFITAYKENFEVFDGSIRVVF